MRRHPFAVTALLLSLSPLLAACSQSEYDACKETATDEWKDYRQDLIDAGGTDDSVKDMYLEMESYIVDQCGVESDYDYE